jgi:hypothetical protein
MNQNKKKKQPNKWLQLISIPVQMGVVIFLFAYLGTFLDENYPNKNINYKTPMLLIGVFLALYNVNRQVNQINKNDE